MAKIVLADNGQGVRFVVRASSVKAAIKKVKRKKDTYFRGIDVSEEFDFEVIDLI